MDRSEHVRIGLDDGEPAVATAAADVVRRLGGEVVRLSDGPSTDVDAVVLTAGLPPAARPHPAPTVGAVVHPGDADTGALDLPAAGWWGGLGTLLAAVCLDVADPPQEVHIAYGLVGPRPTVRRLPRSWRTAAWRLATSSSTARVRSATVAEPFAAGRRLAWFPNPIGPAHAAAVGGLEHLAPLDVPTVRTWWATRSLTAELLQAAGRLDPDGRVGRWLTRSVDRPSPGEDATVALRWAVVVELRTQDGDVVRGWANGTDPVAATGALLGSSALRVAAGAGGGAARSVLDLGGPQGQLDALADLGVLRWQVSRPTPSRR